MGVRIYTCANLTSIMSNEQYRAYLRGFGLKRAMRLNTGRTVRGIGGKRISIGTAAIQIPLRDLSIIIEVEFLILAEATPSLLSIKDMLMNNLDISILWRYISLGPRRYNLKVENYFLIHQWTPNYIPYALYTEDDLRRVHKTFRNPSIIATESLLKRAAGGSIDA